jgi:uncharacterized membrane protein
MFTSATKSLAGAAGTPARAALLSRNLALASLFALFALCLSWELWLAPTGRGTLAIKALPLLLAINGLWRYRLYTFRWLSLLVWLYVAEACVRLYGDTGLSAGLATLELALSLLLFIVCAAHVRVRIKAARLKPQESAA